MIEMNFRNTIEPIKTGENRFIYCSGALSGAGEDGNKTFPGGEVVPFSFIDIPFAVSVSVLVTRGNYSASEVGLYSADTRGRPSRAVARAKKSSSSNGSHFYEFGSRSLAPGRYFMGFYRTTSFTANTSYHKTLYSSSSYGTYMPMELNPALGYTRELSNGGYWYDATAAGLGISDDDINLPENLNTAHLKLTPYAKIKGTGAVWGLPFFALRLEP